MSISNTRLSKRAQLDAGGGRWASRLIVLISHIIGVDFVWNDFRTVFGVGREYAMKTNQVKSGTRH